MKSCTVLIGLDTRLKHCTAPDRMGCEEEGLPFSDWMRQENEIKHSSDWMKREDEALLCYDWMG